MTGGAPRIFHRRRRRRFMVAGVRPDERALKQRTRRSGVFFLVLEGSATSPVNAVIAAGAEKLTVNMHALHNFTVLMSCSLPIISRGSYKCNVECSGDADSASVENAGLEKRGNKNPKKQSI